MSCITETISRKNYVTTFMALSVDAICDVSSMSVSNRSRARKCVNCMYFAHAHIFQTLSMDLPFMQGDTDIANFADDNTP